VNSVERNSRLKVAIENTVPKDVVLWIREKAGQQSYKVRDGIKIKLLGNEIYALLMKGLVVALIAIAAGIVTTGIAIAENEELQTVVELKTEYRDDGVVVVHYSDGSKLFKATMEDGITGSSDISKQVETHLEDKVTVIEKIN